MINSVTQRRRPVASPVGFVLAIVAAVSTATLPSAGCSKPEVPLTRIDRAQALPGARVAWGEIKRLALKLNTHEGPAARVVGAGRTIGAKAGFDADAGALLSLYEDWGPIFAQLAYGPMTDRAYEGTLKDALPCSVYATRRETELKIQLVEPILQLADDPVTSPRN